VGGKGIERRRGEDRRAYPLESPSVVGGLAQGPANILRAALHGSGGRAVAARVLVGVLLALVVLGIVAGALVH
jgi:hypothetical protein